MTADLQVTLTRWSQLLNPSPETAKRIKSHILERIAAPAIIFVDHQETCYRCNGRGWIVCPDIGCDICHGTGIRRWGEGIDFRAEVAK
jgi:hypothetical protein